MEGIVTILATTAAPGALQSIAALGSVPLDLRHTLAGRAHSQRRPLKLSFPLYGKTVQAEVVPGTNGSCVFMRYDLGNAPFTAQDPVVRRQVLDLMNALRRDRDYLQGDVTLLKNQATGMLCLRSSAMLDGAPGMNAVFTELVRFAQQVRPYAEVLQPLLH